MSDRLFDSAHSSTASLSLSVEVSPEWVVAVVANYNMRYVSASKWMGRNCSSGGLYTECTTTPCSSTVMNSTLSSHRQK